MVNSLQRSMIGHVMRVSVLAAGIKLLVVPGLLMAATYEVRPLVDGTGAAVCAGNEEFENLANTLQPGDELILRGGEYCNTGRRFLSVSGTEQAPIVIRAADGEIPVLTRDDDPTGPQTQNGIEIAGAYLVIRGIHFHRGSAGVRFMGGSHHITFEDNEISETANNALTLNSGSTDSFVIRRNQIHHTGLYNGATEGEGMYIGCHTGSCAASNHLIEGNYIHHLRGTSGGGNDGIEIKTGSYGNVVRDNVIHDTTIGQRFPCIFSYGVNDPATEAPNIIERNVMWNCGEAILVTADVVVRNNIVLDSDFGIHINYQNPAPGMRSVTIVNNTVAGSFDQALRVNWSGGPDLTIANNAIYNPAGTAISFLPSVGTFSANLVEGSAPGNSGVINTGNMTADFVDSGARNFWPKPGSGLIGTADPVHIPGDDFNTDPRPSTLDIGAYESAGRTDNPGWQITAGFKTLGSDSSIPKPPYVIENEPR